jgi:hypothetical protein
MKFKIKYGLGGGFGGCDNMEWEYIDADNLNEALDEAYDNACNEYEMYNGMHGLRSVDDIMEEEDCDEDTAEEIWTEERESWLSYRAEQI